MTKKTRTKLIFVASIIFIAGVGGIFIREPAFGAQETYTPPPPIDVLGPPPTTQNTQAYCNSNFYQNCITSEDCPGPLPDKCSSGLEIKNYPTVGGITITKNTTLPELIRYIYTLALMFIGLTAFGVFVFNGFRWMTSMGNPGAMNDAKDWMTKAVIGIGILLSTWILLNLFNPDLLTLKAALPGLQLSPVSVAPPAGGGTPSGGTPSGGEGTPPAPPGLPTGCSLTRIGTVAPACVLVWNNGNPVQGTGSSVQDSAFCTDSQRPVSALTNEGCITCCTQEGTGGEVATGNCSTSQSACEARAAEMGGAGGNCYNYQSEGRWCTFQSAPAPFVCQSNQLWEYVNSRDTRCSKTGTNPQSIPGNALQKICCYAPPQ